MASPQPHQTSDHHLRLPPLTLGPIPFQDRRNLTDRVTRLVRGCMLPEPLEPLVLPPPHIISTIMDMLVPMHRRRTSSNTPLLTNIMLHRTSIRMDFT